MAPTVFVADAAAMQNAPAHFLKYPWPVLNSTTLCYSCS